MLRLAAGDCCKEKEKIIQEVQKQENAALLMQAIARAHLVPALPAKLSALFAHEQDKSMDGGRTF